MNVETAQRLADLRRSKGFSQEGLARKLGLSRQAVSKWERAESSPDTENLISLAKLYGVSLDELLNPSDEIEDDIEFENEDRARQREAEAAERARTHEAAARATEAATQASDAAAKAAQAASWSAQAANAATAQATSGTAVGSTPVKGPFQSFPYWAVCWLLFFLLMFLFGAGPFAALIFFTIPIYHWVARALDGDWARGDIQVGPASVTTRAQNVSASVDADAIMYLATEGLYAEIASSRTGIAERIQREYNIMIAGPTTITALLNSLSMGFRAVAINEKANEVRRLLSVAKAQYEKFGDVLDKAKKKIDEAGRTLVAAQDRNRIMAGKLKGIESMDAAEADAYLGIAEQTDGSED